MFDVSAELVAEWVDTPAAEVRSWWNERVGSAALSVQPLDGLERDAVVVRVLRELDGGKFTTSGPHRRPNWEAAWADRAAQFDSEGRSESLVPRYIAANPVTRALGRYVRPTHGDFETVFSQLFREALFRRFLAEAPSIYEFGCGSGYNLAQLAALYPDVQLVGLDWAQSAVELVGRVAAQRDVCLSARQYDFYNPDPDLRLAPGAAVLTMCALEQVGSGYGPFLEMLLQQRPQLCLHMEPLEELYDESCLEDYLALRYHHTRGYLRGFLTAIRELAACGRAEILRVQRVPMGNLYHEGYSYLAWRPL